LYVVGGEKAMYNEQQKFEFISFVGDSSYEEFFDLFEAWERTLGKDICNMDINEIANLATQGLAKKTLDLYRKKLFTYIEWCRARGLCKINQMDKRVTPDEFLYEIWGARDENYYISPEYLEEIITTLDKTDNPYYFSSIILSCYENIAGENWDNLMHMRLSDIDRATKTIKLKDGSRRKISDRLIYLLTKSADVVELASQRITKLDYCMYPDSVWRFPVAKSGNVYPRFRYWLSRPIANCIGDDKITKSALERSGLFNHIKKRSREMKYDLLHDMISRPRNGKKYSALFEEYGYHLNFASFKNQYKDWVKYV